VIQRAPLLLRLLVGLSGQRWRASRMTSSQSSVARHAQDLRMPAVYIGRRDAWRQLSLTAKLAKRNEDSGCE
jgi:hypothetical protein